MREVNGVIINCIAGVRIANRKCVKAGSNDWFSADNLRFWKTRVGNAVYGSRYFVTSDADFEGYRKYSIRELLDNGRIGTVAFQPYSTRREAHKAAKIIAEMTA